MRICNLCKIEIQDQSTKDKKHCGLYHRECFNLHNRTIKALDDTKKLQLYGMKWRQENKEKSKNYNIQYYKNNKDEIKKACSKYHKKIREDKPLTIFLRAKGRAKRLGLEFNIEISDISIPEYCPILGIKLNQKNTSLQSDSPAIDRIDNTKGYIKGNIAIISARANFMKSNFTFQQVENLFNYVQNNIMFKKE